MNWICKTIRGLGIAVLGVLIVFAGCKRQEALQQVTSEQPTATERPQSRLLSLNEVQQGQRSFGIATKDKLFQSLLGALTKSIGENGVAASIQVCQTKAPELSDSVGKDAGIMIGRTSLQLRNPDNKPPIWAVEFVEQRVEEEVNVQLENEGLGILLPIRLMDACVKCHGDAKSLDEEVVNAIEKHYPADKATGFATGDLRGYFWIEVPHPTDYQPGGIDGKENDK